jgi:ParB-like chromosome segregation protein Spo0J
MTEVPCVRLDHLTDEQRREYAIAHNATAELSEWDLDILPDELAELDLSDFDFDFGIDDEEEDFDESNLDEAVSKTNVIVSINCANVADYESIKERLQNLADEVNATLAVKMA